MIRLIKNELFKIFSKKSIYILGIITIAVTLLSTIVIKGMETSNKDEIEKKEANLKKYNLDNYDEKTQYLKDKTFIDIALEKDKYGIESWQAYLLDNKGYQMLYCINENELNNNIETKNNCGKEYEQLLEDIKNNDWEYFLKNEISSLEAEIKRKQNMHNTIEDDNQLNELNKEITNLNYKLEGLNYHLINKIPMDYSNQSKLIEKYIDDAILYNEIEKDEGKYSDYQKLLEKRELEKNFYETKYKLDNNIKDLDSLSVHELLKSDASCIFFFVIVLAIMISGSIVSEELNKGTIKQLLLRPFSRNKILSSKIIAAIIFLIISLVFNYLTEIICYGFIDGFNSLYEPVIIYNYNINAVQEISLFKYCFYQTLGLLPNYLILILLSLMLGTITGNSALAMSGGFAFYFIGTIINQFTQTSELKILKYLPTTCWDLTPYLFGGISTYKYSNFINSLFISIITIFLLITISIIVFNKKNIKNQ